MMIRDALSEEVTLSRDMKKPLKHWFLQAGSCRLLRTNGGTSLSNFTFSDATFDSLKSEVW